MKPITCIITDDEPYARKGLQAYVEKTSFLQLKGQCEDAMELGEMLKQQPVDLLFLDIQMPHITGVEFLRSLSNPPKVIFTTAFKEYAIEGFELDVLDYMLKPISEERFKKAAYKAKDYFDLKGTTEAPTYLFVKAEGRLEKIVFDEVLYLEGMENYVVIHTATKKIITHSTLKALMDKLPRQQFMQTHKSFIVSLDKVNTIEGNILHVGTHRVPVSRQLREPVMERLINRR
ncbi:LytR/AlgR family response regulator transcription factor [Mucilaginibacter gilvus]|uniref:Response regulator transcription factor n=1 Tax=Mucilaginibacter gilvus TaxID=2305909 RepID=A0A3S4YFA2_9SPHI|nr:LytTR family DNA-binding domain-containing protein [Mucilaginibacter gilvus]RWY53940.1 response regulator transcription factor [Mucilaginibacter gilvus]